MAIQIIADSASDINQGEYEGVTIIPLLVTIDGVTYKDGVDLTKDEFYQKLETSDVLPVTSLASPTVFEEEYRKLKENGDEAIAIILSSELSGTYRSALLAAEEFDNVSVIDSKAGAIAQRMLILRALELIKQGKTRQQIVDIIEQEKEDIVLYAVVDTTKYLLKGGRLSRGASFAASILNIKPILQLEEGKIVAIGKARGFKNSGIFLNKKIAEDGGIDYTRPYCASYSGTEKTNLLNYIEANQDLLPEDNKNIDIFQIGTAVGTHAGPGAIVVSFFKKH